MAQAVIYPTRLHLLINLWGIKFINYTTINNLPDLTDQQMASATRLTLDYHGVDAYDYYSPLWFPVRPKSMELVFNGEEGATYSISTEPMLYHDLFDLILYDKQGNAIAKDLIQGGEGAISVIAQNTISNFVAPYTGDYFIRAYWTNEKFLYDESVTVYMHMLDIDLYKQNIDRIFNWGEAAHPDLFPEHQIPQSDVFGYYARLYSNGDALGEKDGNIYYYDGGSGGTGKIVLVGNVSDFLTQALDAGF